MKKRQYSCNENQLDALFVVSLFRQSTSTRFGIYIYIQQLERVVLFS